MCDVVELVGWELAGSRRGAQALVAPRVEQKLPLSFGDGHALGGQGKVRVTGVNRLQCGEKKEEGRRLGNV